MNNKIGLTSNYFQLCILLKQANESHRDLNALAKSLQGFLLRRNLLKSTKDIRLLESAVYDGDAISRKHACANRHTPISLLWILAKDRNTWVRKSLFYNPLLPIEIINFMINDDDLEVSELFKEKKLTITN